MLDVRTLAIPDVKEIRPSRYSDQRGFFSETWSRRGWALAGIDIEIVQDNHSRSEKPGVVRGLHYQLPPFAQDKIVRCSRGAIFDVAVDIRRSSPTFRRWVGVELSEHTGNQLLVPKGFAHGFVTLAPGTEVQYKVSAPYSPEHDRAIRFDDPVIGIDWPEFGEGFQLSPKDSTAPLLDHAEVFA